MKDEPKPGKIADIRKHSKKTPLEKEIEMVGRRLVNSAQDYCRAGKILDEAKEATPHGEWLSTLKKAGIHERVAQRSMEIFRTYGSPDDITEQTLLGALEKPRISGKSDFDGNLRYSIPPYVARKSRKLAMKIQDFNRAALELVCFALDIPFPNFSIEQEKIIRSLDYHLREEYLEEAPEEKLFDEMAALFGGPNTTRILIISAMTALVDGHAGIFPVLEEMEDD